CRPLGPSLHQTTKHFPSPPLEVAPLLLLLLLHLRLLRRVRRSRGQATTQSPSSIDFEHIRSSSIDRYLFIEYVQQSSIDFSGGKRPTVRFQANLDGDFLGSSLGEWRPAERKEALELSLSPRVEKRKDSTVR